MKKNLRLTALLASFALTPFLSDAFDSGSDGSYGAINFPDSSTPVTNTLALPTNGVFNCTSIYIGTNCYVNFTPNAFNTPVYLLAQSSIVVNGIIDVSGQDGQTNGNFSLPGPGGFGGGLAGIPSANPVVPAGVGQGPGGGRYPGGVPGGGSFGSTGYNYNSAAGSTYGNLLLVPLIGGSGGCGYTGSATYPAVSGGAGGGALLLAASLNVSINGPTSAILARGGRNIMFASSYEWSGGGSGGSVRIVAPTVSVTGSITVAGGTNSASPADGYGGNGRVRIDTTSSLNANVIGNSQAGAALVSYGRSLFVWPPASPQLYFTTVGGNSIQSGTNNAITLPSGSSTNQTVTLCGTNFLGTVPVVIVATPASGTAFITNIVMNFPTTNILVSTNVVISVPVSVPTQLNAYANYGVQP